MEQGAKNGMMIPALKYQDALAAIDWLCRVLGFEKKLVVPGAKLSVAHAQLTLGEGMIMLGSADESEYGKYLKSPILLNGINTQSPYIYIKEIEKHYDQAVKEGAEILISLREEEYGGKFYLCKDPEGNLWSFGSYDPINN